MERLASIVPVAVLLIAAAAAVPAQGGCVDSPEDPTAIFGVIAAAAAVGLRFLKHKD